MGLIYFRMETTMGWDSFWTTIALLPSLFAVILISKVPEGKFATDIKFLLKLITGISLATILITIFSDILKFISLDFALFILPAFIMILIATFARMTPVAASFLLRLSMVLLAFGFFLSFIYFVMMLVPGRADGMSLWSGADSILRNDNVIKAIFTIIALALGLRLSRKIQSDTKVDRPSFILVIFFYSTLLLFVNYLIIVGMNDA